MREIQNKVALVLSLMKGRRRYYAGAAFALVAATVFSYLPPLVMRFAIDSVLGDEESKLLSLLNAAGFLRRLVPILESSLWACGLLMILFAALHGSFSYLRSRWASVAAEKVAKSLRDRLYRHIGRLPFLPAETIDTGDIIQRCSSDVETIRLFVEKQSVEVYRVTVMLAVVIPVMLMLDPVMAAVSTMLIPLVLAASVFYFFRVRTLFGASVESEAEMSSVLQENLTGVRLVRAFSRTGFEMDKFAARNSEYRDRTYTLIRTISVYWGLSAFLCMLQIAVVIIVGTGRVIAGTVTLGTFTVFVTYVGILVWPIRMLGHVLSDLGRASVSLSRVMRILSLPLEGEGETARDKPKILGAVEFRNVSFQYPNSETPALTDISFKVPPGQTVALIGPTGSGKSTLLLLIPRLLEYQKGEILIDGLDLRRIDRQWLRNQMGIVLQEPFLFSRSVLDNIRLGAEEQHEAHVLAAAETASIHSTIEQTFEQGYKTVVGEQGVTLSGGQKQRIAIARAVIRDPRMLLLDDSLSAVDSETDVKIQRALRHESGNTTVFIISHRISTVSQADLILVLDDGRIVQQGNHRELIQREGLYRRICRIQDLLEEDLQREMAGEGPNER